MVDLGNLVAKSTELIKFSNSLEGFLFCFNIPNPHQLRNVDMLDKSYSKTELIPPVVACCCCC